MKIQYLTCRFPTAKELTDQQTVTPAEAATKAGAIEKVSEGRRTYHNTLIAATPRVIWTISPDLLVVAFTSLSEVA